ncbi:uncharacterized protein LOC142552940 isoform X1 [Primulina tabacum]|uniref:uncharacterized protein LOC142552940 isoform X1 n=1 Tax=Primulina tabacum TaxID=48773 RepID=UPI003F594AF6
MGHTKEQLLSLLQELKIECSQYEHPVVLTVEEQAKHVGHMNGALTKNLFLKDKKQRFYIVSALTETKVDLKVLSQRLGLGKGGLRMAPEEALAEIIQVPLGCVTPFALVNESARNVSLLLDQRLKTQEYCFFHPLSNDMSIALNSHDLDKFLSSVGKTPAYVDLEADSTIGKDQPPDLAGLVPLGATVLPNPPENEAPSQGPEKTPISVNNKPTVVTGISVKSSDACEKEKSRATANSPIAFADPDKFVEEILEKTLSTALSGIKQHIEKDQEQLSITMSNHMRKQLGVQLKFIATMFKNTAYTEGFRAGIHSQPNKW